MQDVIKKDSMESIAFVILCGDKDSPNKLKFCLERLNKLNKEQTNIEDIFVYLVAVSDDSKYLKSNMTKKMDYFKDLENLKIEIVLGATAYSTEPRAYNLGIDAFLDGPANYVVMLHETDIVVDKNLLQYYMWLFKTAHNPATIGAVALSSGVPGKKAPTKVKMWYGDDVFIRGACIKKQALKETGPFDESIIYRFFEWDFCSRMIHHAAWLTRIGKEENSFIQFGGPNLTPDHHKLSILNKQSLVWFARKWHYKGVWPEEKEKGFYGNCYVRKNTLYHEGKSGSSFFDKFVLNSNEQEARNDRQFAIYEDVAIKNAIAMSPCFNKKPLGEFTYKNVFSKGVCIRNNPNIQTHVNCKITYWPDMLWTVKGVS